MANEHDTIKRLEAEGWFERARGGDHRACGLFTRLVAYTLNPGGDPSGWGCLTKAPGEKNVEGYSEDAIVKGNDERDLRNVVDIIGGAGAPGATCGFGGFVERRPHNKWEKPVITPEQLLYLRPGGEQPEPTTPDEPEATTPMDDVFEAIANRLDMISQHQEAHGHDLGGIVTALVGIQDEQKQLRAILEDLVARVAVMEFRGSINLPGFLGGTRDITLEQPK